jgi:epoxyqueuosine reductase
MTSERIKQLAAEAGFELAGVAPAEPTLEGAFYAGWIERGFHGEMSYLEGRRGAMRADPRKLLKSARSIICVGQVYNAPHPYSVESDSAAWVARYAWGEDYHRTLKDRLYRLLDTLRAEAGDFRAKVCVDSAPLLERAYARRAGLGWIGKNTCLINEQIGSWVLLGEILTSLEIEPDEPAAFRCGSCTRCIDACPTDAIVPAAAGAGPSHALDSRRCISYWTIEQRGALAEENRSEIGRHVFGCDICQDVCPWNRHERAAETEAEEYQPRHSEPDLAELAALSEAEFDARFASSPIERSRYAGFLRNVAVVMGNSGDRSFLEPLRKLAASDEEVVRDHAEWALGRLGETESGAGGR